jgi:hypothetical protein
MSPLKRITFSFEWRFPFVVLYHEENQWQRRLVRREVRRHVPFAPVLRSKLHFFSFDTHTHTHTNVKSALLVFSKHKRSLGEGYFFCFAFLVFFLLPLHWSVNGLVPKFPCWNLCCLAPSFNNSLGSDVLLFVVAARFVATWETAVLCSWLKEPKISNVHIQSRYDLPLKCV